MTTKLQTLSEMLDAEDEARIQAFRQAQHNRTPAQIAADKAESEERSKRLREEAEKFEAEQAAGLHPEDEDDDEDEEDEDQ